MLLVFSVSVVLSIYEEITALIFMPAEIPRAVRILTALFFPLGTLAFFPVYKRLDARLSIDERQAGLRDSLERMGKAPLLAVLAFFLQTLVFYLPLSLAVTRIYGFGMQMAIYAAMSAVVGFLGVSAIYVLGDQIVSSCLRGIHIKRYPLDISYRRQFLKIIIIPAVVMVASVMAASGAALFTVLNSLEEGEQDGPIAVAFKSILLDILYLFPILILSTTWAKNTSRLYSSVTEQLDAALSSEKNLTQRISVASIDEVAGIAARVNEFTELIQGSMNELQGSVRGQLEALARSGSSIGVAAACISRIEAALKRTDEAQGLAEKSVMAVSESMEEMAGQVTGMAEKSGEQAGFVDESVSLARQMLQRTEAISQSISETVQRSRNLTEAFEESELQVQEVVENIGKVAERSESLQEINQAIAQIAAMTNLLAMNAAIEAAHAGDAGAGFSVVADEIRKLAESTSAYTKTNRQTLKATIEDIAAAAGASEKTMKTVDGMRSALSSAEQAIESISSQAGAQAESQKRLAASLAGTTESTKGAQERMAGLLASRDAAQKAVRELSGYFESLQQNMRLIAEEDRAVIEAIGEAQKASGEAQKIGENTRELADGFTTG